MNNISPSHFWKALSPPVGDRWNTAKQAIILQADKKISDDQINTPGREGMRKEARYKITNKWN